jgi:hypothetical protein
VAADAGCALTRRGITRAWLAEAVHDGEPAAHGKSAGLRILDGWVVAEAIVVSRVTP